MLQICMTCSNLFRSLTRRIELIGSTTHLRHFSFKPGVETLSSSGGRRFRFTRWRLWGGRFRFMRWRLWQRNSSITGLGGTDARIILNAIFAVACRTRHYGGFWFRNSWQWNTFWGQGNSILFWNGSPYCWWTLSRQAIHVSISLYSLFHIVTLNPVGITAVYSVGMLAVSNCNLTLNPVGIPTVYSAGIPAV